ncbi:hypothetical protein GPECTOR_39g492 [Gonium pectorale]|uniref:Arf-GAP domain-containing protein n=1 Tax=Gonium pectorale TaxID=33097 RepID=A0A150GB10_GONPE|nr:hypothetical protein GPECTOR_39g492 [Gonium pectorale]|eukprot:KXZ46998.1 hypothetical protein GPECTOR_39g492 [Gonium pectorale]
MNFNSKRSVTDEQNERHKRLLASILKEEGNKSCADCKTRNPTWASVNLGVFVCLTCSGIHRSLGVHISQVRSCNLDTWLPKQVEFCRVMGNVKGNRYWEARLPKDFRRPPSGNPNPELASFIRAKYVDHAFAATDSQPPTIDNYADHPYAKDDESSSAAAPAAPAAQAPASVRLSATKTSASSPALMMDLLGGFDELASSAPPPATTPPSAPLQHDDPFGSFVTAPPVPAPSAAPIPQRNSLEWTDFHAAPSSSASSNPSGLAAAPVPAPHTLAGLGHQRSHSISEGVATPSASANGQLSRFAAQGPAHDPHKAVAHGHHGGHHGRNHSHPSHSHQQQPVAQAHGSSNGGPAADPFAALAAPDDLLAGLTIHHVMESLASPPMSSAAPPQPPAAADPFQFSSSASAGEDTLRLFDAVPSAAGTGGGGAAAGASDDPFGDFLSAGIGSTHQNGGGKQAAPHPHVQVHAGVNGLSGAGFPNLL